MMLEGYFIARLSDDEDTDNLANFDCVNTNEYKTIERRKKKQLENHSKDMNNFLCEEALEEQAEGYNTTFVLKDQNNNILAYLSLCSDAIKLNYSERDNGQIGYETFPSLKIARLAVHKDHQRSGLGKMMINYAVHIAMEMRQQMCGVKFITLDCFPHRLSYYKDCIGFVENQEIQHGIQHVNMISLRLNIDEYLDDMSSE